MLWWSPLGVSTEGGVGPQVTKFEQVSSGDHQISVAGEGDRCPVLMFVGGKGWGGGQVLRSDIWGGRCPGLCLWERVGAQVCVGGRGYPTNPIMHGTYPPHGQEGIENITLNTFVSDGISVKCQLAIFLEVQAT